MDVLAGGPAVDFGIYSVSASAAEVVGVTSAGNNLLATTLTVTNSTGDASLNINGMGESTIGANGSLHHEQVIGATPILDFLTPSADMWSVVGLNPSTIDSYWVQPYSVALPIPGGGPMETRSLVPSGLPPESLDSVFGPTIFTGFGGVLSDRQPFPAPFSSIAIAYLVFEDLGVDTEVDFSVRPTNANGVSETIAGFIVIPEPASAVLVGVALIGSAGRRIDPAG